MTETAGSSETKSDRSIIVSGQGLTIILNNMYRCSEISLHFVHRYECKREFVRGTLKEGRSLSDSAC
jgi:hypothetical protein